MQLVQCTASLPGGSGQRNSCNTQPHCLGAVGRATPAMYCLNAQGQWAVGLLQCTASLPGGSGQCNSCNALPHCLGAVGSAKAQVARPGHTSLAGRGVLPRRWSVRPEGPTRAPQSSRPRRTSLGQGVLLRWWSVPPDGCERAREVCKARADQPVGIRSPAQAVVGAS